MLQREAQRYMNEEALGGLEYEREPAADDVPFVLCVMCKQHKLLQQQHVFFCRCGFRLETRVRESA